MTVKELISLLEAIPNKDAIVRMEGGTTQSEGTWYTLDDDDVTGVVDLESWVILEGRD